MMFSRLFSLRCPECGEKIVEDDTYCPNCGTNLDTPLQQGMENEERSRQYLEKAQEQYDKGSNLKFALQDCELAIQYEPASAAAHNLRGLILDALKQPERAIEAYEESLRIDPLYEEAQANLFDARSELNGSKSKSSHLNKVALQIVLAFAGIAVVVCVGIAAFTLYKFVLPLMGPKVTIVLEPDYSRLSTMDPAELENTVQILQERSRLFGYGGTSFEMSESGQIICRVPASIEIETFAERVTAVGLLEFVDFGGTSVMPGTVIKTDHEPIHSQQLGDVVWHTVMTNREIKSAEVITDPIGEPGVSFLLTPEGTEILLDYTTNHVGNFLGIVLDKVVISSPQVNSPIPDGMGVIQGAFTQETAEEMVAFLRMEPLPIPLAVKDIQQK